MSDTPKRMGRPRAYDPDVALDQARRVFWDAGFASSSLDELGAAMAMSRPSLYGAFGDKEALYLATLRRYRDECLAGLGAALDPGRPLRDGLAMVYAKSLDTYLDGPGAARGCFMVGTATTEAVQNPRVRQILGDSVRAFDGVIEDRLRIAAGRASSGPTPTRPRWPGWRWRCCNPWRCGRAGATTARPWRPSPDPGWMWSAVRRGGNRTEAPPASCPDGRVGLGDADRQRHLLALDGLRTRRFHWRMYVRAGERRR